MRHYLLTCLFTTIILVMSGCANLGDTTPQALVGVDGQQCVGQLPSGVAGLKTTDDTALLPKAQLPSGKGGVCAAQTYTVTAPITVYRVYDSSNPYSQYGSWWALRTPVGPKAAYRAQNAICKEWSNLDRLTTCQLKPGAEVVLGNTQSVDCQDNVQYPKTADIQVYVPNDQRNNALFVENCQQNGQWP